MQVSKDSVNSCFSTGSRGNDARFEVSGVDAICSRLLSTHKASNVYQVNFYHRIIQYLLCSSDRTGCPEHVNWLDDSASIGSSLENRMGGVRGEEWIR